MSVASFVLPNSWQDPTQPTSQIRPIRRLQRRSQRWIIHWQQQEDMQFTNNIAQIKRWWNVQRFRVLGLVTTVLLLSTNYFFFSPPAFAVVSVVPQFNPTQINPGEVSQLTIAIFNSETTARTNAGLPVTLPAGMTIATPINAGNTCGGTFVPVAGGTTFELQNGTVPPKVGSTNGTCAISLSVTTLLQGNSILNIPALALTNDQNDQNQNPGQATLQVVTVDPPTTTKGFSPSTIFVGSNSTLSVTIANNATIDLTGVDLTDSLPAGVIVNGTPTKSAECQGGTVSTTPTSLILADVTIAPTQTCTFQVPVTSNTTDIYFNTIGVGDISTDQGSSNTQPASAELNVQDATTFPPPTIVRKQFLNDPIVVGTGISRLRIDLRNNSDALSLTGVQLIDNFAPSTEIEIADIPNATTNGNCVGGSFVDDLAGTPGSPAAGDNFFGVTGITIPPERNCRIEVDVKSDTVGTFLNTIPAGAITSDLVGVTNTDSQSDDLRVIDESLTVDKQYGTTNTANVGSVVPLVLTINNPLSVDISNVSLTDIFTDTDPIVNFASPSNIQTTCGGTVTTGPVSPATGNNFISLSGGSVAAGGSCTISVNVIPTATGTHTNHIEIGDLDAIDANGNPVSNTARTSVNLQVGNDNIEITKSFLTNPVDIGEVSRLRLIIRPANISLTQVTDLAVTDILPSGLLLAPSPNVSFNGNCQDLTGDPRTAIATPGSDRLEISGVEIERNRNCQIQVNVVASTHGSYLNDVPVGAIATDEGISNNTSTQDTLNVFGVNVAKDFTPGTIAPGGTSRLRISLENQQLVSIPNISFTDSFPAGATAIAIANPPNTTTTCGPGVVTAAAGGTNLSLANGTIPARIGAVNGLCVVEVDVTSTNSSGSYTNTIPAGTITNPNGFSNLEDTIGVLNFSPLSLDLVKSFNPLNVDAGTPSRLTVLLTNPSPTEEYLDVSFIDNMPTGMLVFAPPNPQTTCTDGVISATSGQSNFSFSGASLPAGSSCTVSLDVTLTQVGTSVNTILAGQATSFQGATNTQNASASISSLPGLGVSKEFDPRIIEPNGVSRLTITVINGDDDSSIAGVAFTDIMPSGLDIATPDNVFTNCTNGTASVDTVANPNTLSLTGATIGLGGTCQVQVDVTASAPGDYVNTIPAGDVTDSSGSSNSAQVTDVLTVATRPTLSKNFSPSTISPGDTSTLTISLNNPNTAPITLTSRLVDTLPANVTVASTPNISGTCTTSSVTAVAGASTVSYANGATIPAGSCTIQVDVTSSVSGTYTNTIPANALSTTAGTNENPDSSDLTVLVVPEITKSFSPSSITAGGVSTLTIQLVNDNTAAQILTSALVDTLPNDVVVAPTANIGGTCSGTVTATPGANTITYGNGSTIPNPSCTITVDVTAPTLGTKTNTIPAGGLQTNVGSNTTPATDDLVVSSVVSTTPDLLLVKRITAINGDDSSFQTFVDDGTLNNEDNNAGWPTPNTFLRGATSVSDVSPEDTVDFTIYFLNAGDGPAQEVRICDLLTQFLDFESDIYSLDRDIQLSIGSTSQSTTFFTEVNDGPIDRGEVFSPGQTPVNCLNPSTNNLITGAENTNGTVAVDVTGSSFTQVPNIPDNNAYGFIRFRARVR
ncbi:MAG: hypothetical protein HC799_08340 [Limnothrix sp. RL_2_0]|nr:hypothetical protein [Limnothrix sp. RL_2_0]